MTIVGRSRGTFPRFDHGEPIRRPDSVVLLLFLCAIALVFIHFAQAPTHALIIDLPWVTAHNERPSDDVEVTEIGLNAEGQITLNDMAISKGDLIQALHFGLVRIPEPYVVFTPAPDASYKDALRVLAIIKGSGQTKFCFGGLEKHRTFEKGWRQTPMRLTLLSPPPAEELYDIWPAKELDCGPTVATNPVGSPIIPAIPPPA